MDVFSYLLGKNSSGGGSGSSINWEEIGYNSMPQYINDDFNYAKEIYDNWDSTQTNLTSKFNANKQLVIMPLVDTSNATNMKTMFNTCDKLRSVPLLDTGNVLNMEKMFSGCTSLTNIPLFNTSKVTVFYQFLSGCNQIKSIPTFDTSSATDVLFMFENCTNLVDVPVFDFKNVGSYGYGMFNGCNSLSDTSLDNILQTCIGMTSYTGTKTLKKMGITSTTIYPVSRIEALPHYQDFINAGWTIGY